MFDNLKGKTVVLTGHTGFKGAWLALWLTQIGAKVHGISLDVPKGQESLHALLGKTAYTESHIQDIRDYKATRAIIHKVKPDCVFHLAAQALVRHSYADPLESFGSNIMGTAHVLEACRDLETPPAIICVTTDKVYDNVDWVWPYRESDPICGKDPYSASKAGAEMVAASYLRSLYKLKGGVRPRLAIVRGGNVIGGGDWAEDRIIPDAVRSAMAGESLRIRNPDAVRPWQHVLELCHGYMTLADKLLSDTPDHYEGPWNFGPDPITILTVFEVVQRLQDNWTHTPLKVKTDRAPTLPEAKYLTLDISKAMRELRWLPGITVEESISLTAQWYADYMQDPKKAVQTTHDQLAFYIERRTQQINAA